MGSFSEFLKTTKMAGGKKSTKSKKIAENVESCKENIENVESCKENVESEVSKIEEKVLHVTVLVLLNQLIFLCGLTLRLFFYYLRYNIYYMLFMLLHDLYSDPAQASPEPEVSDAFNTFSTKNLFQLVF